MSIVTFHYDVIKDDFVKAGEASSHLKKSLKQLGVAQDIIKRVAIATYEAEMNIVIHSEGGQIDVRIDSEKIEILARDYGPGIESVELAMKEGYSTAPPRIREMGFGAGMGLPNIKRCSDEFYIDSRLGEYTALHLKIYH